MATLDGGQPGGSRKRPRTSRNDTSPAAPAAGECNTRVSPALNGVAVSRGAQASEKPCHHEAALRSLHDELDAMRTLLSCQVCRRLMYEPFALSCGHTYCYSCIDQWMHHKKECPSCRSSITQQPTQSYALRDLVLVFASRTQLLADGETSEEHEALAREERQAVANDKANTDEVAGGLFKGLFRTGGRLIPVRDPVDGVDRCPECHWEIEDGYCNFCGLPADDDMSAFSDAMEDEDLDGELEDEDDGDEDELESVYLDADPADDVAAFDARDFHRDGQMLAMLNARREVQRQQGQAAASDEESRSSDEEDDSTMGDFVVDDDAEPTFVTDDEDAESELSGPAITGGNHLVINISEAESNDEDADDGPRATAVTRNRHTVAHRKRRPIVVSSDDEQDGGDEDYDGPNPSAAVQTKTWNTGFSPIELESDDEQSDTHEADETGLASSDVSERYDSDSDEQHDNVVEDDESQDGVGTYAGFGGYDEDGNDDDDDDEQ